MATLTKWIVKFLCDSDGEMQDEFLHELPYNGEPIPTVGHWCWLPSGSGNGYLVTRVDHEYDNCVIIVSVKDSNEVAENGR